MGLVVIGSWMHEPCPRSYPWVTEFQVRGRSKEHDLSWNIVVFPALLALTVKLSKRELARPATSVPGTGRCPLEVKARDSSGRHTVQFLSVDHPVRGRLSFWLLGVLCFWARSHSFHALQCPILQAPEWHRLGPDRRGCPASGCTGAFPLTGNGDKGRRAGQQARRALRLPGR
jgi:hypothetical protein